jgi:hypothetical protein
VEVVWLRGSGQVIAVVADPLRELKSRFRDRPAYVVGRGPSLLAVTKDTFMGWGWGPVITLNRAVIHVRPLVAAYRIVSMQKDGCQGHRWDDPTWHPPGPGHECALITPAPDEIAVVSREEANYCLEAYDPVRIVVEDFGIPWYSMSAEVAVRLAQAIGCTEVVLVGMDSYLSGDTRTVLDDGTLTGDNPHHGYALGAFKAEAAAREFGMPVAWVGQP